MLKDSLLHLPALLLIFAVVFAVLLGLSILASWAVLFNPVFPLEPGWFGKQLSATAGEVLIASLFLALCVLFFRMRKRPGNRVLSFFFTLAVSFIILSAGVTVVYGPPGSPPPKEYGASQPLFVPGTIHNTDGGLVYVHEVNGPSDLIGGGLTNVVLYTDGNLRHVRHASVAIRNGDGPKSAVILPSGDTGDPVILRPANPVYQPIFEPPRFITSLVDDIASLEGLLLEKRTVAPADFSLTLFAILLTATGCVCFSRATRWPLFNAILTLAVFRGFFFMVRFLGSDIGIEIRSMIPIASVREMFFTLVFLAIGVLLTAVNFVFPGKKHG
ncbi:MAG: hypothetical protein JW852_00060 [Spirochaetales bacterium]|nr:hypothetical protein [Spirochaetales bacterium]